MTRFSFAAWVVVPLVAMSAVNSAVARDDLDVSPPDRSVSLTELESFSSSYSYPVGSNLSVDVGQSQAVPSEAYTPGRPIDDGQIRSRMVLSLNAAPNSRVQPYVGAGVQSKDYEQFGSGSPIEGGRSELSNFAYTVVAGVSIDAGAWKLKLDGSNKKFGLAAKLSLN